MWYRAGHISLPKVTGRLAYGMGVPLCLVLEWIMTIMERMEEGHEIAGQTHSGCLLQNADKEMLMLIVLCAGTAQLSVNSGSTSHWHKSR